MKNKEDEQKSNTIVDLNPIILIILNVNGLNTPIKW